MQEICNSSENVEQKRNRQSGQAIVLIAFLMVSLLAMTGLAIDGGGLYYLSRDTQNAVDAALVSGAFAICTTIGNDNSDRVSSVNQAILASTSANGFRDTDPSDSNADDQAVDVIVDYPYNGNYEEVRILIEAEKPKYFIGVVYPGDLIVSSDGVSECATENSSIFDGNAIVGLGTTCDPAVHMTGSNATYIGGLFSNNGFQLQGSSNNGISVEEGTLGLSGDIKGLSQGGCGGPPGSQCLNGLVIDGNTGYEAMQEVNYTSPQQAPLLYHMDQFRPPWEQCFDQSTGLSFACDGRYFTQHIGVGGASGKLFYYGGDGIFAPTGAKLSGGNGGPTGNGYPSSLNPSAADIAAALVPYGNGLPSYDSYFTFGSGGNHYLNNYGLYVLDVNDDGDGVLGDAGDGVWTFGVSGGGSGFDADDTKGFTIVSSGQIQFSGNNITVDAPLVDGDLSFMSWAGAFDSGGNARWFGYEPGVNMGFSSITSGDCNNNAIRTPSSGTTYKGLTYAPFGEVQFSTSAASAEGQVIAYRVQGGFANGVFDFTSNRTAPESRRISIQS